MFKHLKITFENGTTSYFYSAATWEDVNVLCATEGNISAVKVIYEGGEC